MSTEDYNVSHHEIGTAEDHVLRMIKDQASDLEHSWRESVQNGIDAPNSSRVELHANEDRTIVIDNGSGVNIEEKDGRDYLVEMGNSSKGRDDDNSIGEFGIGKGQILAKGRSGFISQGRALLYDIEEWGTDDVRDVSADIVAEYAGEYSETWQSAIEEALELVEDHGFIVVIDHYESETPPSSSRKWNEYRDRVRERFKYAELTMDTQVRLDSEIISDKTPSDEVGGTYTHEETYTTDDGRTAHIAVSHGAHGSLDVYSNGVHVREIATEGITGEVVTEQNLKLNFARNEIQSGCTFWPKIRDRLDEIRTELFEDMPDDRLCEAAREFLARRIVKDSDFARAHSDTPVFKTTSDETLSINDLQDKNEVGVSHGADEDADKLSEAYDLTTLNTSDKATKKLVEDYSGMKTEFALPDVFTPKEKAADLGLRDTPEVVSVEDLEPTQRMKLGVARRLAELMGLSRTILYGESQGRNAWTDASDKIVITDSAARASKWSAWVPELFDTIIHEYAHTRDTLEGCPSHGGRFNRKYRNLHEQEQSVRRQVVNEIEEQGIRSFKVR